MATFITMFDNINIAADPPGAAAYAGYVDGRFANFQALKARFPHARLLSIAVFSADDAECLDVEPGDATSAQIFAWFKRQEKRGVWRPCIYSSVSNWDSIFATMAANGFARASFRAWSAHYTLTPHICGPASCGLVRTPVDATQYTDRALGRSLDESECLDDFFGATPPPPPPPPNNWTAKVIQNLPTLQNGSHDTVGSGRKVVRLQGLLTALGTPVTLDGIFGASTENAVKAQQRSFGLSQDGIVGQATWTSLIDG